ncbi:MAG: hypothetical protein AAFV93_03070 [Chloroflexota bacterium]
MSITIRGLQLPALLTELIEKGIWIDEKFLPEQPLKAMLAKAGLEQPLISIHGLETMKKENLNYIYEDVKVFDNEFLTELEKVYAVRSSKYHNHPIIDSKLLDVDKAILIASNGHGEDMLHLDYRSNLSEPRVMALIGEVSEWIVIAPNFTTFVTDLKLVH